ncbi:aromatic-ring-hydroxylating dioxygenase subunit beta [Rhodococcus qingshengii]|uniref:aromatic-ring-hydroxylating dioxygenase subunit beta n=1 Tax=Rhodococcus qingshengii TaxID=334542 RepID=UPI001ADEC95E|nr:3-phenylpropionate/cinnamic acid dioxygenase subunit beta [Rhodococcus qingshengii]
MALQFAVERFYATEANLLDERRFEEWLDLLADDVRYRIPMAQNVSFSDMSSEYLDDDLAVHWLDEGKETLTHRVRQIRTGVHWAEEPLSRTSHLVTNVLLEDGVTSDDIEIRVKSHILSYRQRLADQEDVLVGRRHDTLRRTGSGWSISERTIYINQTVYLGSSFSHFI